ncbi:MAG: hypothetical protein ACREUQ_10585 [Burkholderiales bacterium]
MATDKLKIYNGALLLVGELPLDLTSGLSENRTARFMLDLVWDDGGVRYCLEQGQWHFAMRASRLDFNPSVDPDWGYNRAFDKPTDWVATSGVFEDEYMRSPLLDYADEVSFWFCDRDEIFVRYVSDDTAFGMDFARWPSSFTDFVKAYFASRIVHKIPGGAAQREFLLGPPGHEDRGWLNRTLLIAKNKAAMTGPATFPQRGTWARARHAGQHRSFRDGGNQNSLIG